MTRRVHRNLATVRFKMRRTRMRRESARVDVLQRPMACQGRRWLECVNLSRCVCACVCTKCFHLCKSTQNRTQDRFSSSCLAFGARFPSPQKKKRVSQSCMCGSGEAIRGAGSPTILLFKFVALALQRLCERRACHPDDEEHKTRSPLP